MTYVQTAEHFLPICAEPADKPSTVVWVIAAGAGAAVKLAIKTAKGELPRLYEFECDCRAAWRATPLPLASRHVPYRVELWAHPLGFYSVSSKRIDR